MLGFVLLSTSMVSTLGCQLIYQVAEIPDAILDFAPENRGPPPEWLSLNLRPSESNAVHSGEILSLRTLSSDNRSQPDLLSVAADGLVLLWSLETGVSRLVASLAHKPTLATFGRNRAVVAYVSGETIYVECLVDCGRSWSFNKSRTQTRSIAFHADDSALLITGIDGKIIRWKFLEEERAVTKIQREKTFELYSGHQTVVEVLASHPFDRTFFSADWSGALFAWLPYDRDDAGGAYDRNLFTGEFFAAPGTFIKQLRPADRGITSLVISPDGELLVLGTEDGFVEVWKIRGMEIFARTQIHFGRILSVDLSPSQKSIVSASRDGTVVVSQLVEDKTFKKADKTFRQKILRERLFSLEGLKKGLLTSDNSVVVGLQSGKILELDPEMTEQIAPIFLTPEPVMREPRPEDPKDSDY